MNHDIVFVYGYHQNPSTLSLEVYEMIWWSGSYWQTATGLLCRWIINSHFSFFLRWLILHPIAIKLCGFWRLIPNIYLIIIPLQNQQNVARRTDFGLLDYLATERLGRPRVITQPTARRRLFPPLASILPTSPSYSERVLGDPGVPRLFPNRVCLSSNSILILLPSCRPAIASSNLIP